MHKDKHNQPLKRGFYRDSSSLGIIVYFTGEETASGEAIMEQQDFNYPDLNSLPKYGASETSRLTPLGLNDFLSDILREQKDMLLANHEWVKLKQSQLEREAQQSLPLSENVSNQSDHPDDDIPF